MATEFYPALYTGIDYSKIFTPEKIKFLSRYTNWLRHISKIHPYKYM
jgi:hypothetical protein